MNRRQVIRHFLVVGTGLVLVPSCVHRDGKASLALHSIKINQDQEEFLKELADAIIPPTDTPGAVELGSHLFALKMVDDCLPEADQKAFLAGLNKLQSEPVNPAQLKETAEKNKDEEALSFLRTYRKWIIQGYTQSEYVMTNLLPYKLVPGKYYGCVPVGTSTSKN